MNAPQKTHYADDETLEYIAGLEQELCKLRALKHGRKGELQHYLETTHKYLDLESRCHALELSAKKSAEEAEDMKAALRYYADKRTYETQHEQSDYGYRPIDADRGEIARRVLGEKASCA